MADSTALYQTQANSIYDPQLAAEQAQTTAGWNADQIGFTDQTNTTNNAYNDALKAATAAEQGGEADNNFNAQTHGLFTSGLAVNANRLTYGKYQDNVTTTSNVRAQKLATIAASQQASKQKYDADLGALSSKYQGSKASYIADHVNADTAAAQAQAAAMAKEQYSQSMQNARAGSKAPSTSEKAQILQSSLNSDIQGLFSNFKGQPKGYTEAKVLPALLAAYPELKASDVSNQVYAYRKAIGGG